MLIGTLIIFRLTLAPKKAGHIDGSCVEDVSAILLRWEELKINDRRFC